MKTLQQFILEGTKSFSGDEIKKMFGKSNAKLALFMNSFQRDFLDNIHRKYSLTNKTDRENLYSLFNEKCGKKQDQKFLRSILLSSINGLAALMLDNMDLINAKLGNEYITRKLTKAEKSLRKWKLTDEYVPLQDYDENDEYAEDEELGRAFIIYYAYDPADKSSLKVYRVNGKTTDPNVKHIQNMHKADWNYETKLGYYHANTCTVSHYRKSGKDQLIQDYINNDELYDD